VSGCFDGPQPIRQPKSIDKNAGLITELDAKQMKTPAGRLLGLKEAVGRDLGVMIEES
jgi:hypothetical protein